MNITKPEQEMITALRNKGYDVEIQNLTDYGTEIGKLKKRLDELEARTGLLHPAWFTRAMTAWVYVMGIQLIGAVIILVFVSVIGYLLGN